MGVDGREQGWEWEWEWGVSASLASGIGRGGEYGVVTFGLVCVCLCVLARERVACAGVRVCGCAGVCVWAGGRVCGLLAPPSSCSACSSSSPTTRGTTPGGRGWSQAAGEGVVRSLPPRRGFSPPILYLFSPALASSRLTPRAGCGRWPPRGRQLVLCARLSVARPR